MYFEELKLTVIEFLSYSTIRIVAEVGNRTSTGTGFFFNFLKNEKGVVPVIITNRHVVEGSSVGKLVFTFGRDDGGPDVGKTVTVTVPQFSEKWIFHPDASVDLCLMPLKNVLDQVYLDHKRNVFFVTLDWDTIPKPELIQKLIGLEKVVVIGYPNGLWDEYNNSPIMRSGVLATNIKQNWKGKPEFLIDCPIYPGSSGSPVIICDVGQFVTTEGIQIGPTRMLFLGTVYATCLHRFDGKIVMVQIPTSEHLVSSNSVPNNLGVVIKSSELLRFKEVFR